MVVSSRVVENPIFATERGVPRPPECGPPSAGPEDADGVVAVCAELLLAQALYRGAVNLASK